MKRIFLIAFILLIASISWAGPDISGGGGASSASGVVALFGSGSCSGYLKSDGTCDSPAMTAAAIVAYTADATPTSDDLIITVNAPGGTAALRKVTLAALQTYILGATPSANMTSFFAAADYAAMRTALGMAIGTDVQAYNQYYMKKSSAALTEGQYTVTDANGDLVSGGAPITDNSTASHLLCKDSDGRVENCGGVTVSGTTSPVVNVNPQEVDGHTTSTDLTAAQVSNTVIHNIGHADNTDTFLILPTAAAGYSFLVNIGEADANHFCVEAGANDAIHLIAAAGTVAAGADGAAVCMMAAQVGQSFACWTFKHTDDYDWMCKAISIGTSTFEAHASSE